MMDLARQRKFDVLLVRELDATLFGEDVMISGFGKFCAKKKKERKGRNPATGDDMMLESRQAVTFKCSGRLREKLNGA